uniref:Uncharacterized protein n=1 Tax=Heterorhabditis bacteriophora TaxID=37862 RepID=A0A1I7W7I2_HETBA
MVLMVVTPIGGIYRYGTDRLGVCLNEDQQRGLPGCLRTSSSHVSPTIPSRSTKTWLEDNDVDILDWLSRLEFNGESLGNSWSPICTSKAWSEVDESVIKNS